MTPLTQAQACLEALNIAHIERKAFSIGGKENVDNWHKFTAAIESAQAPVDTLSEQGDGCPPSLSIKTPCPSEIAENERQADRLPDGWCTLGVGDGAGRLFVHGDYESIKACQAKLLRQEPTEIAEQREGLRSIREFIQWIELESNEDIVMENAGKALDLIDRMIGGE